MAVVTSPKQSIATRFSSLHEIPDQKYLQSRQAFEIQISQLIQINVRDANYIINELIECQCIDTENPLSNLRKLTLNSEMKSCIEALHEAIINYVNAILNTEIQTRRALEVANHLQEIAKKFRKNIDDLRDKEYYPLNLRKLVDKINNVVKWNFTVRIPIAMAMEKITIESLTHRIHFPNPLPDELSEHFIQIHDLTQKILSLASGDEERKAMAITLVEDVRKASREIERRTQVIENIQRITKLETLSFEEKTIVRLLSPLFRCPANQKLNDNQIDHKFLSMFSVLEENARISPESFEQSLGKQWNLDFEDSHKHSLELANYLVKNNPYTKSVIQMFLEGLKRDNFSHLKKKNLCYQENDSIFSIKIDKVEKDISNQSTFIITSLEGLRAVLIIDEFLGKIIGFHYQKQWSDSLGGMIRKTLKEGSSQFTIEQKNIFKFSDLFEQGMRYTLHIKESNSFWGVLWMTTSTKRHTYTFIPQSESSPHIVCEGDPDSHNFLCTKGNDNTITIPLPWNHFCCHFECVQYENIKLDAKTLNEKFLYLSRNDPPTSSKMKKDLLERDQLRISIIQNLINVYHDEKDKKHDLLQNVITFIANHPGEDIPKHLVSDLLFRDLNFQKLCLNQYVRADDSQKKNELAMNLIQQINLVNITHTEVVSQVGNSELLESLNAAISLTKLLEGKQGIVFVGSTGAGKSTLVSYMMGLEMKEFTDRFGEKRIKHKEDLGGLNSPVPKLGFSLGISETTFARGFELLSANDPVVDPEQPWLEPEPTEPSFSNGITRDNLVLVDCPGFFDTRGTQFEVITNFSIDRTIAAIDGILALVQVISYEDITSGKSRLLLTTLKDLEIKFPRLLTDQNLQNKLFFVVTKYRDISIEQIQDRINQVAEEYKTEGLSDYKYFDFLSKQILNENLFLINPIISRGRLDFLNTVINKFNSDDKDIIKLHYQNGFNNSAMQLNLLNILHGSMTCWELLIKKTLKVKRNLEKLIHKIGEGTSKIKNKESQLRDLNERYTNFTSKKYDIDHFDEIENDPDLKNYFEASQAAAKSALESAQQQHNQLENEIADLERKNSNKLDEINKLREEITKLEEGSSIQPLCNLEYKIGQSVPVRTRRCDKQTLDAKMKRCIERGDDKLSGGEEDTTTSSFVVGQKETETWDKIKLLKEHELVPSSMDSEEKLKRLDELVGGIRSVRLDGGFRIDIEAENIEFIHILDHEGGKKIMYGFREIFHKDPPYPKLIITHTIPNAVLNQSDIDEKRAQIGGLANELGINTCQINVKRGSRDEYGKIKESQRKYLGESVSRSIEQMKKSYLETTSSLEKEISQLKIEQDQNKKLKTEIEFTQKRCLFSIEYHLSVIEGTRQIAEFFKPTTTEFEKIDIKSQEVSKKCKEFTHFYDENKEAIKEEIKAKKLSLAGPSGHVN